MSQPRKTSRAKRRSNCPISFALGIFGDRWTLLILRDLILRNKCRFKEMLASPEGIATNVLSDRLRRLVDAGLVVREPDTDDQRQWIYRPTEKALDLVPMLVELVVWGARSDSRTAVPRTFIEQFDDDREALIEGIKNRFAAK